MTIQAPWRTALFTLACALAGVCAPIGPTAFTGSGLNDASFGGAYSGALTPRAAYVVVMSQVGKVDSFTWTVNGGGASPALTITGGAQSLSDGVTIRFKSTTGHTRGDSWKTTIGNDSVGDFMADGKAATIRSSQEKERDFINVRDYGAKCDGSTNDQLAIQNAIDATGQGTLYIPPNCVVASPGLFLYPANSGINLVGLGNSSYGNNSPSLAHLIAYAPSPPTAILTDFAQNPHIRNLVIDCNGKAENGFVDVMGITSYVENLTARRCTGDGSQGNQYATPASTLSANASSGSSSITVTSVTQNRLTLGARPYCTAVMIDYGQSTQEQIAVSGISGNTLRLGGKLAFSHAANTGTVRCSGTLNDSHFIQYQSFNNGGWGWHLVLGSDVNAIRWENGASSANALGGELWGGGSVHVHIGGNYEADAGPAIQLGEITNRQGTHFGYWGPVGDVEESMPAYNIISIVCDDSSQLNATVETSVVFQTGAKACPTYPRGSSSSVYGTFINGVGPGFWVHTVNGYVETSPGNPGTIRFFDPARKLLLSVPSNLAMQLGSDSVTATGALTSYQGINSTTEMSGSGCDNDAICASLPDTNRSISWFPKPGARIAIRLVTHTLRAGANTLTLNGVTRKICSHFNPANPITTGYGSGSIFNATLAENGCWADDSQ